MNMHHMEDKIEVVLMHKGECKIVRVRPDTPYVRLSVRDDSCGYLAFGERIYYLTGARDEHGRPVYGEAQ